MARELDPLQKIKDEYPKILLARTHHPELDQQGIRVLDIARFVPRMRARVDVFGLDTVSGVASKVVDLFEQPIDVPLWYVRALLVFVLLSPALWLVLRHRVGRWIGFAALAAYYVWGFLPCGA